MWVMGPVIQRIRASTKVANTPKHAIDFSNKPFRLVEIPALFQFGVERDEEDDAEGVRPQIPEAVRPDALGTHPCQLVEDIP